MAMDALNFVFRYLYVASKHALSADILEWKHMA